MKYIILGAGFSLATVLALSGGEHLPEDPAAVVQGLKWPVIFNAENFLIEASFPIPSRRIGQIAPEDKLYVAQGENQNGEMRTFSLSFQKDPLIPSANAKEALENFLSLLAEPPEVQVNPLTLTRNPSDVKQGTFAAVEVQDRQRTDIYFVRIMKIGEGQLTAIHTLEKGSSSLDIHQPEYWNFLDSVEISP